MKHVGIIGAGASGLVCAIEAARKGHHVSIFEKNAKVGRKILATGNGRCNITNQNIALSRYHGESVHLLKDLFKRFDTLTCKTFFKSLGLEMREGEGGRLYPMSHQSSSVVDLLLHEAHSLGVVFYLETEVDDITCKEEMFLLHVKEQIYSFEACIIATGSLAMPMLGSSGSGYTFAKSLGHHVFEPCASLVQILSNETSLKEASGVKMDAVIDLFINNQKMQTASGDMLFTNYGLSGSAILDLSRMVSKASMTHQSMHVMIDLLPMLSRDALSVLLQKRLPIASGKSVALWLEGLIPKKVAHFILHYAKLDHLKSALELSPKEIKKLVFALKSLKIDIEGSKGFESAEVCAGGVDVCEIDAKTLMSHKRKNLYFCGEVLDVDGDCGGFNLHFAWASGYTVGKNL